MAAIIDILVLSSKGYFFNPGIALDYSEQVQSFSKGVQMTPVEAKLPEACGDTSCGGISLIEPLIFQHSENEIATMTEYPHTFSVQGYLCYQMPLFPRQPPTSLGLHAEG